MAGAYKVWPGWFAWGKDPATELLTKKYRKLTILTEWDRQPPEPVCTGGALSLGVFSSFAEYEFDEVLMRRPMAGAFNFGYERGTISPCTLSKFTDGSIDGGLKLMWDSGECGTRVVTDPYSAYGDPGFFGYPWPADCTPASAGNAYSQSFLLEDVPLITGPLNPPTTTTIVDDETLILEWVIGSSLMRITLTLSLPMTLADLIVDVKNLLAAVNYGDTILVGTSDNFETRTFSPASVSVIFITEENLCEDGAVQKSFTVNGSAWNMPALYNACGSGSAALYWNSDGAWAVKSKIVPPDLVTTYCKESGPVTKSNTYDYDAVLTCTCLDTGITGTIEVGPDDVPGLGWLSVGQEPCGFC
jgi:hypothetical protein